MTDTAQPLQSCKPLQLHAYLLKACSPSRGVALTGHHRKQGVGVDLGSAPGEGRGVNSGSRRAAGIPPTRFIHQTPGPDFNFSAETFGG